MKFWQITQFPLYQIIAWAKQNVCGHNSPKLSPVCGLGLTQCYPGLSTGKNIIHSKAHNTAPFPAALEDQNAGHIVLSSSVGPGMQQ